MGNLDINVDEVKKLIELVEKHNLDELFVAEDDLSITIKRHPTQHIVPNLPNSGDIISNAPVFYDEDEPEIDEMDESGHSDDENIFDIKAPIVGVFYRSPAPDAPPFVEVGDYIEVGQEVGLIEAMKVFNPIPSDVAGTVVEILGQSGKLVQQGEVLIRVKIEE